ncbi:MAG: RNA polymerase sigma factor [Ktedonobacterales bacterium]
MPERRHRGSRIPDGTPPASALRLAYLLTGERTQAEDVVQDSFLQVFRSIRRFRLGHAFTPWLHSIVHTSHISACGVSQGVAK